MNNLEKLKLGLQKTKNKLFTGLTEAFTGRAIIDEEVISRLEELLISADVGIDTTEQIIESARYNLINNNGRDEASLKKSIFDEFKKILESTNNNYVNKKEHVKPIINLIVGVNGVGKTTSIGKLAYLDKKDGKKVLICAADTFRAAATEQLDIWANRVNVDIIKGDIGADPSSVAYKAVEKSISEKYDITYIDTAGRLHTKNNLMEELGKIKRVIEKKLLRAPDNTYLVLDSTNGQNALTQANEFKKVTYLDGIILTKLDGTSKGGIIFQIAKTLNIPIKYIGIGEGLEDLQQFDPDSFINAFLN
ncbi:MAG: signal recognition particle-docking protein FtsY [Ignavibacteriales bacterium CG12_big_fil_rev_8_21_14_0_65_30_8]|nr:MAG: signal recognition particle-docking protein FtsY [Ignavibacteriales bacterium CG12_big_fil_rev_8_21_14_0_65_30_8]